MFIVKIIRNIPSSPHSLQIQHFLNNMLSYLLRPT